MPANFNTDVEKCIDNGAIPTKLRRDHGLGGTADMNHTKLIAQITVTTLSQPKSAPLFLASFFFPCGSILLAGKEPKERERKRTTPLFRLSMDAVALTRTLGDH